LKGFLKANKGTSFDIYIFEVFKEISEFIQKSSKPLKYIKYVVSSNEKCSYNFFFLYF